MAMLLRMDLFNKKKWQLILLDGTIDVAKPTRAYSAMKLGDIVYEGISLRCNLTSLLLSSARANIVHSDFRCDWPGLSHSRR